ncbi:MAG TPA: CocE/NonD family hydrolase [Micromonosporaceae bacterium]|nr:CocE/NonD family hydrolase [Micromonosporaceae bacterium]
MTVASRLADRILDLPPALTRRVTVHRDIDITARDGTVLRTDHYAPALPPRGGGSPPTGATVLVRTPYGRKGIRGLISGRLIAERGFHVVVQSCRGTFDSGGTFAPMRHERDDGLDTVEWIQKQPWFDGDLFTYGPSYLGFTQWAIAADAGPELRGMLTAVTSSTFRASTYAGGAFSLDTVLNWATLLGNQGGSLPRFLWRQTRSQSLLRRAFTHLPLAGADVLATGAEIAFFREWLDAVDDDAYWAQRSHDHRVEEVTVPICMVGGWYDIFLPWQLEDYRRLRTVGRQPRLVIGPWTHAHKGLFERSLSEGIAWFRAQLDGAAPAGTDKPVEVYVGGTGRWRSFGEWPPAGGTREWSIRPGGELVEGPAEAATGGDRFRYDPADPTPSPGGPLLTQAAGRCDNTAVEARDDVLVYSTGRLDAPVEAIGPVTATVRIRSSSPHFDLFLRLCDVDPAGRSENICDGLLRLDPAHPVDPDGARTIDIELWPTAYTWLPGHRLRLQVAGGAHPRYARNPGTGEPLGSATRLQAVDHEFLGGTLRLHRAD